MCSTLTSLLVVILAVVAIWYQTLRSPATVGTRYLNTSYDYIIVGAGSSGAVVASRLSEDDRVSVLVVEAGGSGEDNPHIRTPLVYTLVQKSKEDWAYETVPQKFSCKALKGDRSAWPRGRVLGGTSCLNSMVYIRGSRHDYDEWQSQGCNGWSYRDVLPYFIKSEDIRVPELKSSDYHGRGGPLAVSDGVVTPLPEVHRRAMEELGYPSVDSNGEEQEGFSPAQLSVGDGERYDTGKAFLRPVMARKNLHVSLHSLVTKVIIENKRAVGIEFIRDGRKHRVVANKEVILSAGAVDSPKLLLLSGIGPKAHLDSLGIPVHSDLPVGENLQDHLFTAIKYYNNQSYAITKPKVTTWSNIAKYMLFGGGTLRSSGIEANAFFRTDQNIKSADVQFHFVSAAASDDSELSQKIFNLKRNVADIMAEALPKDGREEFFVVVILLRPKSKGTIRLASTDPFDPPVIDPHYLEHNDDVKTMIRGIRIALKLGNTSAYQKMGATPSDFYTPSLPNCKEHKFLSDEFLECWVRHFTFTVYHPTTTCRMGDVNDPTAVVDSSLRVKGISNLRVADASVIRNVPSGNTNAPCIMVGEKAADLIRGIDSVKHIREKLNKVI